MRIITKILINTLAILLVTSFMPGVSVDGVFTAVVLSVVLGILNTFIKPVLIFFTLPITIFTLGLFLLVINAVIILIASSLVGGFHVKGPWHAMLFSIVLSLVITVFEKLLFPQRRNEDGR